MYASRLVPDLSVEGVSVRFGGNYHLPNGEHHPPNLFNTVNRYIRWRSPVDQTFQRVGSTMSSLRMVIGVAMLSVLAQSALGAVFVHVDLDASTPGIQSTIDVTIGSTVNAEIVLESTEGSPVSGYHVSVLFDRGFLDFGSPAPVSTGIDVNNDGTINGLTSVDLQPLSAITTQDNSPLGDPIFAVRGLYDNIDGINLSNTSTPSNFIGTIARINLEATTITPQSVADNVRAGLFNPATNNLVDDQGLAINNVVFNHGTVTVTNVPEASSLVFLGIAAAGVYRIRRRRRLTS